MKQILKQIRNNKGLSLVELIVAFAIASIAGVAVFGLMSAGSNHFRSTGKDVGLQYEQQVVVNRLRDSIIEASNAISYDDINKILYVYNVKDMGVTASGAVMHEYKYEITKIFLDGTDLKYASGIFDDLNPANLEDATPSLLGQDVKDIHFDLSEVNEGRILFDITFAVNDKEITSQQIVALRNAVKMVTESGDVIFVSEESFYSNTIEAVIIKRDGHIFEQNETTTIGLNGSTTIKVPFEYEVRATETSRDYYATWSLETFVDGMSVDSATGILTIIPAKVGAGTNVNRLICRSIDDPSKYQSIKIDITNDGVYPVSLSLHHDDGTNYVGYRDYVIYPEITYTDNSKKIDGDLCTWKITYLNDQGKAVKLPTGCLFELDKESHKYTFRATSALNGKSVKFTATVKAPKVDGTKVDSQTITLNIEGIKDAADSNELSLGAQDSMYNKRGNAVTVMSSWQKVNSVSDYTYHWKIEPAGESWGSTGDTRSNFSDTIKIKDKLNDWNNPLVESEGDGWYKSASGISYLYVYSESWLDWAREYQVKVLCYATDKNGKRFGMGNDLEENYTGPVEKIVSFKPVKIILKPLSTYYENNSKSLNLVNSNVLRRGVVQNSDGTYSNDNIENIGDKTLRLFEITSTGVDFGPSKTGTVKISSLAYNGATETNDNTKFTFWNTPTKAVQKENIKGYFDQYNNGGTGVYITGFTADFNNPAFKTYYSKFYDNTQAIDKKTKPVYVTVTFRASDSKGNKASVYYLTGSNMYNSKHLTLTEEYYYEIKYDPNKLNDPDYVEIR